MFALRRSGRFRDRRRLRAAQRSLERSSGLLNVRQPLRRVFERVPEELGLPFGAHPSEAIAALFPLFVSHSSSSLLIQSTGECVGLTLFFSPSL